MLSERCPNNGGRAIKMTLERIKNLFVFCYSWYLLSKICAVPGSNVLNSGIFEVEGIEEEFQMGR